MCGGFRNFIFISFFDDVPTATHWPLTDYINRVSSFGGHLNKENVFCFSHFHRLKVIVNRVVCNATPPKCLRFPVLFEVYRWTDCV